MVWFNHPSLLGGAAVVPSIIGSPTLGALSTSGTSNTFSHTVAAGTTKLVVTAHILNGSINNASITGVTYNAVAMTEVVQNNQVYSGANSMATGIYYLDSPATGAHNVVITTFGAQSPLGGGEAYNLKDTQSGVNTSNNNSAVNTQTVSATLTTTAGAVIIGAATCTDASAQTVTWSNLTEDRDESSSGGKVAGAASAVENSSVSSKSYGVTSSVATPTAVGFCVAAFN